jgi:hypothetical protein
MRRAWPDGHYSTEVACFRLVVLNYAGRLQIANFKMQIANWRGVGLCGGG